MALINFVRLEENRENVTNSEGLIKAETTSTLHALHARMNFRVSCFSLK